jgi:hypothetical protein
MPQSKLNLDPSLFFVMHSRVFNSHENVGYEQPTSRSETSYPPVPIDLDLHRGEQASIAFWKMTSKRLAVPATQQKWMRLDIPPPGGPY